MIGEDYHLWFEQNRIWEKCRWLGMPAWKLPNDILILQEIIFDTQPDLIIETGTAHGGSALFYASILELLGHGNVITVEKNPQKRDLPLVTNIRRIIYDRIHFVDGDSIDDKTFKRIAFLAMSKKVMVILDSDHRKEHVLNEMELYGKLVSKDCYMVVEDTHSNGHPIPWEYGDGPWEAVEEYLKTHDEFVVDETREKFGMSFNINGHLLRVK